MKKNTEEETDNFAHEEEGTVDGQQARDEEVQELEWMCDGIAGFFQRWRIM